MARIHRGKAQARLRASQTFSHNWDMVMEVLGRLVIVCLIWAMICIRVGNNSFSDLEQDYGLQGFQPVEGQGAAGYPAAASNDGGPHIVTPEDLRPPDYDIPSEPTAANDIALPELTTRGNVDLGSKLAVDAYRSRLDLDAKQTAFMQPYDRVRRALEQGAALNGLAVWKGKQAERKELDNVFPFIRRDRSEDRDDLDGSDSFWTPTS